MKKYVLYLMLFAGLVTSCNTEQIYQEEGSLAGNSLKLDVTRAGFMEYSETGSRISNSGLSTSFTEGDVIGVLVTQEGKNYNVPYKLNSAGMWEFDNTSGKEIFLKTAAGQLTYRIYYPYSALADNATDKETLESALSIKGNQSAESDYINSDILYEEVTSADHNISVELKHLRSMFSFKPKVKFQTTVATGQNEYYDIQVQDIKFYDGNAEIQCFKTSEGEFRYILDSDKIITWTYEYNGIVYEGSKDLSSVVEGTKYSVIEYHNLGVYNETKARVGDFYCCSSGNNTGYILPKEYDLASSNTHTCIGIVFHVGVGNGDDNTIYGEPIKTNGIKGYVVALNDAHQSSGSWGIRDTNEALPDKDQADNAFDGYFNTKAIVALPAYSTTDIASPNANNQYWSFKVACEYNVNAPVTSSGWYLPSIGQLVEIGRLKDIIEGSGAVPFKLNPPDCISGETNYGNGGYWSSTEKDKTDAWFYSFQRSSAEAWSKGTWFIKESYVRPILTF